MIEFFDIYTGEKIQFFPIPIYKKNLKMSSRANVETKSVEIVAENKRQHLGDSLGSGGRAAFSYRRKKSNIWWKFLKINLCTSDSSHDSSGVRCQWERGFTKKSNKTLGHTARVYITVSKQINYCILWRTQTGESRWTHGRSPKNLSQSSLTSQRCSLQSHQCAWDQDWASCTQMQKQNSW